MNLISSSFSRRMSLLICRSPNSCSARCDLSSVHPEWSIGRDRSARLGANCWYLREKIMILIYSMPNQKTLAGRSVSFRDASRYLPDGLRHDLGWTDIKKKCDISWELALHNITLMKIWIKIISAILILLSDYHAARVPFNWDLEWTCSSTRMAFSDMEPGRQFHIEARRLQQYQLVEFSIDPAPQFGRLGLSALFLTPSNIKWRIPLQSTYGGER
jgi:hypothetical protein